MKSDKTIQIQEVIYLNHGEIVSIDGHWYKLMTEEEVMESIPKKGWCVLEDKSAT